jgi:hypothetical protein
MVWYVAADGRYPVYLRLCISSGNRPASRHQGRNWPILKGKDPWPRPQRERCLLSFASEPERDDGGLPPVNIVIPDDARELDRDVLAYRREVRAQRRRQRLMRLLRPFNRSGLGGPTAIVPLIALCLALALVGGALLSVVTMTPAAAPTVTTTPTSAQADLPSDLTRLPAGNVRVDGRTEPARSIVSSVVALVPADCNCEQQWDRLAGQAVAAGVPVYFVGTGATRQQVAAESVLYAYGRAQVVDDVDDVFANAYRPDGLTALLVDGNAKAEVRRDLGSNFDLGPALSGLKSASAKTSAQATPGASAASAG